MSTSSSVSSALDNMFERPQGLYGAFEDIPLISQKGHNRRVELLQSLDIGDVSKMVCCDFGMGSWGFGSVFPKLHDCARAVGFDISAKAIEMSLELVRNSKPKYWEHFDAYQSDGMQIPLPDGSVDLFFSGESIEHVKFAPKFLNEIYRVLKADGQLIVTTPNRDAIRYKEKGEEYCTSPEHFWLFSYRELVDTVSIFFNIQEQYGFNGSFGSLDEDRTERDEQKAEAWSREFRDRPDLATGVVMRLTKKPGIVGSYEITDIPPSQMKIVGASQYLPLEFGLKGLFLENPSHSITIQRPASDGIVCRTWCHRWSGVASIEPSDRPKQLMDLYTHVPGWRNWISRDVTAGVTEVRISPTARKNDKAEGDQVIFFEAFTWRFVGGSAPIWCAPVATRSYSNLFTPGSSYTRYKPFVGTTVFTWFTPQGGNINGPWPPVGGRSRWTGDAKFWKGQIKEMMLAKIDAVYLHFLDSFQEQRREFLNAYAQLRSEGWDVPKIAPYVDPFNLYMNDPIDVSTKAGKDAFARPFIEFYKEYFEANKDRDAASYLLTIDGQLVLSTWWVFSLLKNVERLSREDITSRLEAAIGALKLPQIRHPIYMMTTALIDPDLAFSDERIVMFAGYAYAIHSVHKGVDVWHVQAGYWDQNIRTPGYFLPRDGGKNYRRAWEAVIAAMPQVHRVYVESWNEYDEGSGIYAADPDGLYVRPGMHDNTDTFSDRGDPYEYIRTTAEGAARINGLPDWRGAFLRHSANQAVRIRDCIQLDVVMRNAGNKCWSALDDVSLVVRDQAGTIVGQCKLSSVLEAQLFFPDGIIRGQPVTFVVDISAPVDGGQSYTGRLEHSGQSIEGSEFAIDGILSV